MTKFYLFINRKLTICMIHSATRHNKPTSHYYQHGLSLLELTIVLLILMALAGLVLPTFNEVPRYAQCTATKSTMKAIRDALLGNIDGVGYVADVGVFPHSLAALLGSTPPSYCSDRSITTNAACTTAGETWQPENIFNPVTTMGWRGSYLHEPATLTATDLSSGNFENPTTVANSHIDPYLAIGDLATLDSFSHGSSVRRPIILQIPPVPVTIPPTPADKFVRLVSAGGDGILQTAIADAPGTNRGDDIVLYLKTSDPTPITPTNPDQTGCVLTDS